MHRILVEEKRWVSESRFLHALNYCMLLPGPEAQQLAIYIGWLLHRGIGGLVAGTLFVLPGFVAILALSVVYAGYRESVLVAALFFGLKPAVMAIVLEAVLRIGRRALKNRVMVGLAAAAFVAIFFYAVPFPLIVVSAAAIGLVGGRVWPQYFHVPAAHGADGGAALSDDVGDNVRPRMARTVGVGVLWLTLWLAPLALLVAVSGRDDVLVKEAIFFSKAAVVTFGGAYAVLAYMAQDVVQSYGWLTAGEMLDGLGLAETTPGPLILVTEFVGFLAAHRHGGGNPWIMGGLGAVVTLWATFAPCFLWIFTGAPYIERLNAEPRLKAALAAVTAAVVGVILNLTVWFALHVLFGSVGPASLGPLHLLVPEVSSLSVTALLLSVLAVLLLFALHRGIITTLAVCGAGALALHAAGL
jgi:chromate transporter